MTKKDSKRWRGMLAVAVLVGAFSIPTVAAAKEIVLVENGTSAYTIVIAGDAPPPVRMAAEELQRYVRAISDAVLPISSTTSKPTEICVRLAGPGDPSLTGQGEDAHLMRSEGERIVLAGNCPRSALFAVYAFLEKYLGCAWCAPGDDTVPRRATIRLAAFDDTVAAPAFSVRQIILYPYDASLLQKNNIPHTDWLTKNRMNWAHPAPNGPYVWEKVRSHEVFVPEVEKRGLLLEVGGHTFNTWVPNDRYAASHPEYFAVQADGKRAMDGTHRAGLCLSQPGVLKTVTENMIRWLDENPEADAVDLWHNDSNTYCCCPDCTGPGLSGKAASDAYTRTYIRFANAVADEVAKHFYVYEYYTIASNYKKWSMVSMIAQDLRYFHRLGICGISSDQWGPGWYPLNMYAFARLTWNPQLSPQEIIEDFCRGYYGAASGPMIAYWSLLEEGLCESWQTDKPIDWRDAQRAEVVKKALTMADSDQVKRRIQATAALHQLAIP